MKAKVVPMRFQSTSMEDFHKILTPLSEIYQDEVEFLEPKVLGEGLPANAEAVLFPVIWSDLYEETEALRALHLPIIVLTTRFGVSLMFDWEAVAFLKDKGLQVFNPHSVELAKTLFRALALKTSMHSGKFLIFQDTDYDGLIPEQFKIFYWWHEQCTRDIYEKFGIRIVRKPYKELGKKAATIPDDDARKEAARWDFPNCIADERPLLSSIKLFMALRDAVDEEGNVVAGGINCLNEAYDSDTTPCLAWSLLYQDRGVIGVCEGDTSSLMTQYLVSKTIGGPVFTTNIYPFLSGMPALSHEKIQAFPDVDDPDDHALLVHCGYLGLLPQATAHKWCLKPCVLGWLVGENSVAVDAEIGTGDITFCKLHASMNSLFAEKAVLEEYVQYPGSDCRNGGLIRLADGYRLMERIRSHHVIVTTGKRLNQLKTVCEIFNLNLDV